jgi:5-methylcytosine-specific restriction endonuclease McrA
MPAFKDLTGQRFGSLTVIERVKDRKYTTWKCLCECGRYTDVIASNLKCTKSCGCKQYSVLAEKYTKNEIGKRFVKLVAVEKIIRPRINNGKKNGNYVCYRCICDCGKETVVWGAHLRNGSIVSCGCYSAEQFGKRNYKHGLSDTKEYISAKTRKRDDLKKIHDTDWDVKKEIFLRRLFQECVVCGITEQEHQLKYNQSLHIDHIIPLHSGHGLSVGNATVLCARCNSEKQAKDINALPERVRNRIQLASELFELLYKE